MLSYIAHVTPWPYPNIGLFIVQLHLSGSIAYNPEIILGSGLFLAVCPWCKGAGRSGANILTKTKEVNYRKLERLPRLQLGIVN